MKANKDVIFRAIADEYVLIPTGEASRGKNGLFALTPVGAEIWKLLEEGLSREEMLVRLVAMYDADAETIRQDMNEFLVKLVEAGLAEEE